MKNVGSVDRLIRIILGILVLSLFFVLQGALKWVSIIGIILIITGLINFCPLYVPFKINTNKKDK
ncbi:YgaP family membrane protein [Fusibacter bizertensis]